MMRRYILFFLCLVLLATAPAFAQPDPNHPGKPVYDKWCTHCHGDEGNGQGVAAMRVLPRPRDFTSGKYKIRMTTSGNIPLDDDIKRSIRLGLHGTSMPAFPSDRINDQELEDLTQYIKSFSDWFTDSEYADPETITIPTPPPYSEEFASTEGRRVYEETGCGRCHGEMGRGDGNSAPTLVDDWGNFIRVANLTQPWTFRAGGTREDIYRTMSTGFTGTPMPGFHGSISESDMWAISDYMLYLAGGPPEGDTYEAPYGNQMTAIGVDVDLDLSNPDLFADAPSTTFPIVGQIMEPGRNFYPTNYAVMARAIFNDDEIAFEIKWHDMRAETVGVSGPDLQVPVWDDQLVEEGLSPLGWGDYAAGAADAGGDEGDFWGDDDDDGGGDFWGDEEETTEDEGDFWGDDDDTGGGDDFWGDDDDDDGGGASAGPTDQTDEFNDAVALQFPQTAPEGIRRPYFIFGDAQNPVDVWFRDTGADAAMYYTGRGSKAITPNEDIDPPETTVNYDNGEWTVVFKRQRLRGGIAFEEGEFVPIAFSTWDGFNRERGNKRGLTGWRYVFMQPRETPSPIEPMMKAGLGVLGLEFLIIFFVRRQRKKAAAA